MGRKTGFSSKPITLTSDNLRFSGFGFFPEFESGFLKSFLLEGTTFSALGNEFRRPRSEAGFSGFLRGDDTGFS